MALLVHSMLTTALTLFLLMRLSAGAEPKLEPPSGKEADWELLSAQVLMRHGNRYPVEPTYDADRNLDGVEKGMLTADGIEDTLVTGKHLRAMYVDGKFLKDATLKDEVFVTVTKVPRAQHSLKLCLHTFFNVNKPLNQSLDKHVPPIPINYQPYTKNGIYTAPLMSTEDFDCPRYNAHVNEAIEEFVQMLNEEHKDILNYAKKYTGAKRMRQFELLEGFHYELQLNQRVPQFAKMPLQFPRYNGATLGEAVQKLCIDFQKAMAAGLPGDLRNGLLLFHWLQRMSRIVFSTRTPTVREKFALYVAHSETQVGLLSILGIKEVMPLHPSGAIILETWRNKKTGNNVVKVRQYCKSYIVTLRLPHYCGKKMECSFDTFTEELLPKAIGSVADLQNQCAIPLPSRFQSVFEIGTPSVNVSAKKARVEALQPIGK